MTVSLMLFKGTGNQKKNDSNSFTIPKITSVFKIEMMLKIFTFHSEYISLFHIFTISDKIKDNADH